MTSCTELEQINRLVGGSEPAVVLRTGVFLFLDIAVLRTYEYLPAALRLRIAIAMLDDTMPAARHRERKMQRYPDQSSSLWREVLFRPYVLISVGSSSLLFLSFLMSFGGCSLVPWLLFLQPTQMCPFLCSRARNSHNNSQSIQITETA